MTNTQHVRNNPIAATILLQLGWNKFIAMTGSSNFVAAGPSLSMKLKRNKSGANYLMITYHADRDHYTMEFLSHRTRAGRLNIKTVVKFVGTSCEQLQPNFSWATGMATRLY